MAYKRVNKVLIGKDLAYRGTITLAADDPGDLVDAGTIIVAGPDKQILAAREYPEAKYIYVGVATGAYSETMYDGALYYVAEVDWSDPIDGNLVREAFLTLYTPAIEKTVVVDLGTFDPGVVIGEEYAVKLVYKDIYEHPAHFTHTYRVIAQTDVEADLAALFVERINSDPRARVVAEANIDGTFNITGRVIPSVNDKNAIDEYTQVEFQAFLFSDNYPIDAEITLDAVAWPGTGTAALVRDAEKIALSHKGITNRTKFPVKMPELKVEWDLDPVGEEVRGGYNYVTIVHDRMYVAANQQYLEEAQLLTQIYCPFNENQLLEVIQELDDWLLTTPHPFVIIPAPFVP